MPEDLLFEDRDDWDRFDAARNELLDELAGWLGRERGLAGPAVDELAWFVHLAMDWKFSYADGHLARWDRQDIAEFLLEWCPRKVSIGADECRDLPEALASYIEFLDRTGRLASGSERAELLAATARRLVGEHVSAMSDPGTFGMAKSLMAAAAADGVDLEDQAAIAPVDPGVQRPVVRGTLAGPHRRDRGNGAARADVDATDATGRPSR